MGDLFGAIGGKVLEFVVSVAAPAIATLVVGVLVRWFKRLGLDLTAQQEERLRQLVREAIKAVEEHSRHRPMTGEEKRDRAAQIVQELAPKADPKRVDELIHATLPDVRPQFTGPVPATPGTFGR